MSLPSLEIILDREQHWLSAKEQAQRAVDYAERQLQNCHRLKMLVGEQVTLVLLHGGECD